MRTTRLFFFGAYETSVASSLKPNIDEPALLLLLVNWGGNSRRFFRTVPMSPKSRFRSSRRSAKEVKKLSVTTVLPTSRRSVSSKATFIPSCEVRPAPLSLPRYGFMCTQYPVAASHKHQNFSPYFAGFEGMYCLKLQRPRKVTNVSSTMTYSLGMYGFA